MKLAMESLETGAPGLSPLIRQGIARSIAMKVVASQVSQEGADMASTMSREQFLSARLAERSTELEKVKEALRLIMEGYPRSDVSHEEFRVTAYKIALDALGAESLLVSFFGGRK